MKDMVTIGLTGDVMPGRTHDRVITEKVYDYPAANMLPVMKRADMNLINIPDFGAVFSPEGKITLEPDANKIQTASL